MKQGEREISFACSACMFILKCTTNDCHKFAASNARPKHKMSISECFEYFTSSNTVVI